MVKDLTYRFGPLPIALAGGLVLGLLTLTIPNSLFESLISATGISEFISAAAPPLGYKARIAIALATALLAFGVLALLLVREQDTIQSTYDKDNDVGDLKFAADNDWQDEAAPRQQRSKKLSWADRLRGMLPVVRDASPDDIRELEDLPKLRREDRHPDAPARAPVLAGRDLGDNADQPSPAQKADGAVNNVRKRLGNLIPLDLVGSDGDSAGEMPLVVKKSVMANPEPQRAPQQAPAAPAPAPAPAIPAAVLADEETDAPVAPDNFYAAKESSFAAAQGVEDEAPANAPEVAAKEAAPLSAPKGEPDSDADLNDLSLGELIDRLEQGIDRLKIASEKPAAKATQPEEPVEESKAEAAVPPRIVQPVAMPSGVESEAQAPAQSKPVEAAPVTQAPVQPSPAESAPKAAPEQAEGPDAAKETAKPAPKQAEPVTDPDDMDEALRAALETLRQMTAKQRNVS